MPRPGVVGWCGDDDHTVRIRWGNGAIAPMPNLEQALDGGIPPEGLPLEFPGEVPDPAAATKEIGHIAWRGVGRDRRRVVIIGPRRRGRAHEIDRPWTIEDVTLSCRDEGWLGADATTQAARILKEHNFPVEWGLNYCSVAAGERRVVLPLSDGGGFGHAWAWIGDRLCWAAIPEHGILDLSQYGAEGVLEEFRGPKQCPSSRSWNRACDSSAFRRAFPVGAPIHWALHVANYTRSIQMLREPGGVVQDQQIAIDLTARLAFNLGTFLAEHRAHELYRAACKAKTIKSSNANADGADIRWRGFSLDFLISYRKANPSRGRGPMYQALVLALTAENEKREAGQKLSLPGPDQFKAQVQAWEKAGALLRSTKNPLARGGSRESGV